MKQKHQKHNVIEINGRRYDVSSGAPLEHADATVELVRHADSHKTVSVPVHIIKPTETAHASEHSKSPRTHATRRSTAQNLKSHAPQPTKTLMRQAVRKPAPLSRPRKLKVSGWVDVPTNVKVVVKPSASRLDDSRLRHAQHIKRSHLISRFNRRQLVAGPDFMSSFTIETNTVTPPSQPPASPASARSKKPRTTADILEMALQNATSHLEPPVKPIKHRRVWHRRHAAAH